MVLSSADGASGRLHRDLRWIRTRCGSSRSMRRCLRVLNRRPGCARRSGGRPARSHATTTRACRPSGSRCTRTSAARNIGAPCGSTRRAMLDPARRRGLSDEPGRGCRMFRTPSGTRRRPRPSSACPSRSTPASRWSSRLQLQSEGLPRRVRVVAGTVIGRENLRKIRRLGRLWMRENCCRWTTRTNQPALNAMRLGIGPEQSPVDCGTRR